MLRGALKICACAQLYEEICDAAQCTDTGCDHSDAPATVLLLPAAYSVINESSIPDLVDLLNIGELRGDNVGALTFGAEIPEYKNNGIKRRAFPTAPTWQARPSVPPLHLVLHAHASTQESTRIACWSRLLCL